MPMGSLAHIDVAAKRIIPDHAEKKVLDITCINMSFDGAASSVRFATTNGVYSLGGKI